MPTRQIRLMMLLMCYSILLIGCASRSTLIHPEWQSHTPNKIAVIGFVAYDKPGFLYTQEDKDAINPELWWYPEFNDSLFSLLSTDFPEYDFISPSDVHKKLTVLDKIDLLDSLIHEINRNVKRPPGFKIWVNLDEISDGLIYNLCDLLDVDALFFGVAKIEPMSLSNGGLLIKTQSVSVQLLTGTHLVDKNNLELWRFSQRFSTIVSQDLKFQLLGGYFKRDLLSIANGPNLVRRALEFYPKVFPHKSAYNIEVLPAIEKYPIIKYDKKALLVTLPSEGNSSIRNTDKIVVFNSESSYIVHKWNYENNGKKIPSGDYELLIHYADGQEDVITLKKLNTFEK